MSARESLHVWKAKLADRTSVDQLHLTSLKQRPSDKPHVVATTQLYPNLGQAQLSLQSLFTPPVGSRNQICEPSSWDGAVV